MNHETNDAGTLKRRIYDLKNIRKPENQDFHNPKILKHHDGDS
jgi:hypothetical protein